MSDDVGSFPHDLAGEVFNTVKSRHKFIFKVYNILFIQLAVTFGITALFSYHVGVRDWVQGKPGLVWLGFFLTLAIMIPLVCVPGVARSSPMNYILLSMFTLVEGYLVGVVASFYEAESVVYAVAVTMFITLALSLFACQTKFDFTGLGPYLMAFLFAVIGFGLVLAIVCGSSECQVARTVYGALGAALFSFYLVYDTQLIVGGTHRKFKLNEDEHVFGALMLYLDIINLFLYILSLLGNRRD